MPKIGSTGCPIGCHCSGKSRELITAAPDLGHRRCRRRRLSPIDLSLGSRIACPEIRKGRADGPDAARG
jgi:hypothetical protein